MTKVGLVAIALLLISPIAAYAQSKEDCRKIALATPSATVSLTKLESTISNVDWRLVSKISQGEIKTTSERARLAQEELLASLRKYINTLEDITHLLNLCARREE